MTPLKTFTIRLSQRTILDIEKLVEMLKSQQNVGKVNKRSVARLAISKGIDTLLSELDGGASSNLK